MPEKTLIYVSVSYANSPQYHWEPTPTIHEHGNCYRIIEENPDPEHLYPQFKNGEIVRCEKNKFADYEYGLTAVERCRHEKRNNSE